MTTDADIAILGGGCAGLSLARALSRFRGDARVVIIEPRTQYTDDRTWCFWRPRDHPHPLAHQSWQSWRLSAEGDRAGERGAVLTGDRFAYQMVRSGDFYGDALAGIAKTPRIELKLGCRVNELHRQKDCWHVETDRGRLTARFIVDTRPPPRAAMAQALMAQVFIGVEVHTERAVFDPVCVELMANMTATGGGMVFDYVLPFSPTHALIELTAFQDPALASTESLNAQVEARIAQLLERRGAPHYTLGRREQGCLPMGLPHRRTQAPGLYPAGTAAGALRPSSGYGFLRMQDWAARCARAVETTGRPIAQPADPALRRVMDATFLSAIRRDPKRAPGFFLAMAKALSGDGFARFMTDQAAAGDWTRVIAGLPKWPLLAALPAGLKHAAAPT